MKTPYLFRLITISKLTQGISISAAHDESSIPASPIQTAFQLKSAFQGLVRRHPLSDHKRWHQTQNRAVVVVAVKTYADYIPWNTSRRPARRWILDGSLSKALIATYILLSSYNIFNSVGCEASAPSFGIHCLKPPAHVPCSSRHHRVFRRQQVFQWLTVLWYRSLKGYSFFYCCHPALYALVGFRIQLQIKHSSIL